MKKEIDEYLSFVLIEKKLSVNTKDAYGSDLNFFSEFLKDKDVKKISDSDIKNYINYLYDMKETDKTIARKIVSVKTFFDYLMLNHKISTNPCEKIESPKIKKTLPNTLQLEEINKLLDIKCVKANDYRNKAMLYLMFASGLRVSEVVNLEINDINFNDNYVRIFGKGKKERIVPVDSYTTNLLEEYIKVYRDSLLKGYLTDNVFIGSYGKKITRQSIFKIIKKQAKEKNINKEISPHTIRHSFATIMLENGADLRSIGEMLGHENIKTTQIYTHLSNNKKRLDYEKYHPRNKK